MSNKSTRITALSSLFITVLLIAGCAPPTAKIKVSRQEVKAGDPVTVSWETKNAKTIEVNGEKVEKIGGKTMTPAKTTTYEVVAKRGKKEARDRAEVTVTVVRPPMPTVSLKADPSNIDLGKNTTLRWESANATTLTITGLGEVPASGSREVSPRVSTTYTANAIGAGGNATASTRVTVTDPPPPPVAERPRVTQPTEPPIAEQFRAILKSVFFDYDKSDISASDQEQLRRAADWLNLERNRSITFRVEGNCDPRGTAEYNLGLGDRRARAIKEFLVSLGVDASRIEIVSYGSEKAAGTVEGTTSAPPSWAHDRRGDFVYLRGGERP
jgi:peptidoglycan-associated lipoprotein